MRSSFSALKAPAAMLAALTLFGASAQAATIYQTMDLTAIEGTSWSNINSQPVRLDFGTGYGKGTVTLTAIGGGSMGVSANAIPVSGLPYYNYSQALGNGGTLNSGPFGTGVFTVRAPSNYAGFTLDFKLDSGNFLAGSLFTIGSLDNVGNGGRYELFGPGSEFGAPDSASLPSDGSIPLVQITTDAFGPLYGAGAPGVSETRGFALLQDVDSFSIRMLGFNQGSRASGGLSFSFAPVLGGAVPEPSTWMMLILGFGCIGGMMRRSVAASADGTARLRRTPAAA